MNPDTKSLALATANLGTGRGKPVRRGAWVGLKRAIVLAAAAVLSALILTSALPPLVADQSDRAVVNAPVTLITSPIDGDVTSLAAQPGATIGARSRVAEIVNRRIDRSTLIMLEGKRSDAEENLRAIRAKKDSDAAFIQALADEIDRQTTIVEARYVQQIVELQALVGASQAAVEEKKQVVSRQTEMVAREVASPALVGAATQQYAGAKFQQESSQSKLLEKQAQLDSARHGIFVGDDVHDLAALIQKKREMEFDVQRLGIEEVQVAAAMQDQERLLGAERSRLDSLERATVETPGPGEVIYIGAAPGRRVSAGDTLARMVDCQASFVVGIFSYREGSNLAVGARMLIDAGAAGTRGGTVMEVLPKTSDKVDETYAVPFPQTERRELYVLVKPDAPLRRAIADGRDQCDIGRWVTVTSQDGWVPSTSVLWHAVARQVVTRAEAAGGAIAEAWTAFRGGASGDADDARATRASIE